MEAGWSKNKVSVVMAGRNKDRVERGISEEEHGKACCSRSWCSSVVRKGADGVMVHKEDDGAMVA